VEDERVPDRRPARGNADAAIGGPQLVEVNGRQVDRVALAGGRVELDPEPDLPGQVAVVERDLLHRAERAAAERRELDPEPLGGLLEGAVVAAGLTTGRQEAGQAQGDDRKA
jgi:hypothetical protein